MVVVTPRAQKAHLSCAFVEHRRLFETSLFWQDATRCILRLVQEIQIVTLVSD